MTWWEQTRDEQTIVNKLPIKCPVCKIILEYRFPEDKTWSYCKECRSNFYYPPYKDIPTKAVPDAFKRGRGCGCGKCGR
jgi:hypothetical protein